MKKAPAFARNVCRALFGPKIHMGPTAARITGCAFLAVWTAIFVGLVRQHGITFGNAFFFFFIVGTLVLYVQRNKSFRALSKRHYPSEVRMKLYIDGTNYLYFEDVKIPELIRIQKNLRLESWIWMPIFLLFGLLATAGV